MIEQKQITAPDAKRAFFYVFGLTLLIKLWLAASFPMTGDEAYFYLWGKHPAWGFYDHPPMIGWLMTALMSVSSHPLVLRIVTVLLWCLIALGMIDLMKRLAPGEEAKAWLLGAVFLTMPFTWALNVVTNDTPLILFVFFSAYCYLRAALDERLGWYLLAGAWLGLALLSKYFAGLLAVAYFIHFLLAARTWHGFRNLLLVALAALPFAAIHIAYNATNCWNNIMFNFYNRNESAQFSLLTVVLYLLMMVYLLTPWVTLRLRRAWPRDKTELTALLLFAVPFFLFLLLSLKKTVGLHWVLAFMPFAFLYVALKIDNAALRRYIGWGAWFSLPHLVVLAAVVLLPVEFWEGRSAHAGVVFHKNTPQIVAALRQDLPTDAVLMTTSYTPAAILSFHAGQYIPVFGVGTHHARQNDTAADFRQFDGKPVRIFDRSEIDLKQLQPYFASLSLESFNVAGVQYWYADGRSFNYAKYREEILSTIAQRYYRIPDFLPRCGCNFLEKYGFGEPIR